MKVVATFHFHSKYARATSKNMDLDGISAGMKVKGLDLAGTGDFTFPAWFEELKKLEEIDNTGIFRYNDAHFMLTGEVSTTFEHENKIRRVHHVIQAPSLEIVGQINEALSKFGNLSSDGRPMLSMTAAELVEVLMEISSDIVITSAHIWTPFFSVFGSKSGFNSVEECYQDQTKHIFSLETGLSSTPDMNWRLSSLDKFTLVSSCDSHSQNPWRLGREANVFELKKLTYNEIWDAVRKKDKSKFLYTIEVPPEYGKYHYTGHRNCGISLHPKEAMKVNNVCPKCRRGLTIGVMQRVDELADRPEGYVPKDAIPFKSLLPLYEIISFVTKVNKLYSKKTLDEQNRLIDRFGTELNVLLDASEEELREATKEEIAEAVIKVRGCKIQFEPGYDGVYGTPIFDENYVRKEIVLPKQKSLKEF
ncbi:MAG: DNA helicase UvrD [Candidatus Aenigmarchaeota archaeon]|nr:DNA helicase UvrD [Candidatus Aenigmarchaeota archaeon]